MNFFQFAAKNVSEKGFFSLYNGLSAGITRQLFYATSRFGLFEVFRDQIAQHRTVGVPERIVAGLASGACAALVSCPAEVRVTAQNCVILIVRLTACGWLWCTLGLAGTHVKRFAAPGRGPTQL